MEFRNLGMSMIFYPQWWPLFFNFYESKEGKLIMVPTFLTVILAFNVCSSNVTRITCETTETLWRSLFLTIVISSWERHSMSSLLIFPLHILSLLMIRKSYFIGLKSFFEWKFEKFFHMKWNLLFRWKLIGPVCFIWSGNQMLENSEILKISITVEGTFGDNLWLTIML